MRRRRSDAMMSSRLTDAQREAFSRLLRLQSERIALQIRAHIVYLNMDFEPGDIQLSPAGQSITLQAIRGRLMRIIPTKPYE